MKTIDEVIEEEMTTAEYYKLTHCYTSAQEHEQHAGWLKELKQLRQERNQTIDAFEKELLSSNLLSDYIKDLIKNTAARMKGDEP